MNDYTGLTPALLAGVGIGDLPPLVQPTLIRDGRLVEVMPEWHLPTFDLSVVHLSNLYISRPVRLLHGMLDAALPWQTSLRLAERLASRDVVVTLVKEGDHRLSKEADLARLAATLDEMLSADDRSHLEAVPR